MDRYVELNGEVAVLIAALLGVPLRRAPYDVAGAPVFELTVRSAVLDRDVLLLLWPSLRRADVRIGDSSLVFKRIDAVELYPGVEVLFRRDEPPGYLFLSVDGRASMVL